MLGAGGRCHRVGSELQRIKRHALYEYQCEAAAPVRGDPEVLGRTRSSVCPKCGGPVVKLHVVAGDSVQGHGWYITDYAQKGQAGHDGEDRGRVEFRRVGVLDATPATSGSSRPTSRHAKKTTRQEGGIGAGRRLSPPQVDDIPCRAETQPDADYARPAS